MRYTANRKYGKPIELRDNSGALLASVSRSSWFAVKGAIIAIQDTEYIVTPKGFFQMSVEVTRGEQQVFSLRFRPMGKVEITNANGTTYLLKRVNLWRGYYGLLTESGQQITTIRPHFELSSFRMRYDIDTDDNYAEGRDPLLVSLLVYMIDVMQRTAAAAV